VISGEFTTKKSQIDLYSLIKKPSEVSSVNRHVLRENETEGILSTVKKGSPREKDSFFKER
jgi:ribosomal protein S25